MCLTPIYLPNPNKGVISKSVRTGLRPKVSRKELDFLASFLPPSKIIKIRESRPFIGSYLKDCTSDYIEVPCRKCPECLKSRQYDWIQRIELESMRSHLFFQTLTYNDEHMPYLVTETGEHIKCVSWDDLHLYMQRIYDNNLFGRPYRYLAVSERGSLKKRPHFHILFAVDRYPSDSLYYGEDLVQKLYFPLLEEWYQNVGSRRSPIKEPLLTYVEKWQHGVLRKTYDFSFVKETGKADLFTSISTYVTKYIISEVDGYEGKLQKALKMNYSPELAKKYWISVKSKMNASPYFGWSVGDSPIFKYLRECVDFSIASGSDYPLYFHQHNGVAEPLANYYVNRVKYPKDYCGPILITEKDLAGFYYNSDSKYLDGRVDKDLVPISKIDSIYDHYSSIVSQLELY